MYVCLKQIVKINFSEQFILHDIYDIWLEMPIYGCL